jgi:hypothetical protein
MEMSKVESAAVLFAANEVIETVKELNDLELSIVGGGLGDITLG